MDREHRQRPLHGHEGPQAGVDRLELAARDAVRHGAHARAAVSLEVHPEQAERPELRAEVVGQRALLVPTRHVRGELLRGELGDGVADRAVLVGEQVIDIEIVVHQRPFHSGLRLALNAAWNSAWSWVVISRAWVMASSSIAGPSGMSSSRVISDLVCE